MNARFQYVVVCSDGTSYAIDNRAAFMKWGQPKEPRFDLGPLLTAGWAPVRESAMGGGEHYCYSLVLLEQPAK